MKFSLRSPRELYIASQPLYNDAAVVEEAFPQDSQETNLSDDFLPALCRRTNLPRIGNLLKREVKTEERINIYIYILGIDGAVCKAGVLL